MTDKEIIKALPFLAKYCKKEYNELRVDEALLGAFDLINRQKSQIEDLFVALDKRMQRIKELKAEVDRLQNHNLRMARKHYDDGVREFAERLKAYFITPAQTKIDAEIVEYIDTLVKEMTEETDNV